MIPVWHRIELPEQRPCRRASLGPGWDYWSLPTHAAATRASCASPPCEPSWPAASSPRRRVAAPLAALGQPRHALLPPPCRVFNGGPLQRRHRGRDVARHRGWHQGRARTAHVAGAADGDPRRIALREDGFGDRHSTFGPTGVSCVNGSQLRSHPEGRNHISAKLCAHHLDALHASLSGGCARLCDAPRP